VKAQIVSAIRAGHAIMLAWPEHEIVNALEKRTGG